MADAQPLPPSLIDKAAEKLERLIDNVVVLRVTTIIGAAHVEADSAVDRGAETRIVFDAGSQQLIASTTLNMLLGDFTQIVNPAFVEKADYAKLHKDAMDVARAVRNETMSLLKNIAKDIEQRF